VLQVMIGLVVGQIIVWGCGASSRVPARWKIRGCEVGRVDAEQHGGLAEGGSLPHRCVRTLLCITAKSIVEWQSWVRSVELVPRATFPLYPHEPT
jgi:hypothetical protein